MNRKLLRFLLYYGPLLIGAGVLGFLATNHGGFMASWRLFMRSVIWLTPEMPQYHADLNPDTHIGEQFNIFPVNIALRKIAHVLVYIPLSLLAARALQNGEPKLRARAIIGQAILCVVLTGLECLVRLRYAGERHIRWEQLYLNLTGSGIAILFTLIFFGFKALERRLNA
ncbi:MAG: hypothetical protein QM758_08665 [Armatimonas sp.]